MGRKRVIYQSEALFASRTGLTGNAQQSGSEIDTRLDAMGVTLGPVQIHRVQSINYSFDITRQDINQFGQLAAIDRQIIEQPTVSLDFSYYCETGHNEKVIGLDVVRMTGNKEDGLYWNTKGLADGTKHSCISGILKGASRTHNLNAVAEANPGSLGGDDQRTDLMTYFIQTYAEGDDAKGSTSSPKSVISIGNGFLSSYSANGSVGDFVTADVSIEALNMQFENNTLDLIQDPTINEENGRLQYGITGSAGVGQGAGNAGRINMPEVTDGFTTTDAPEGVSSSTDTPKALRHGDIQLILSDVALGHQVTDAAETHAQNFTFSFDLSRTNLERLGSRFAYAKEIDFPLSASCDFNFIVGEQDAADELNYGASAAANSSQAEGVEAFLNQGFDKSANLFVRCFGPSTGAYSADNNANLDGMGFALLGGKLDSQGYSSSIGDNKTMDISLSSQIAGPQDNANGVVLFHIADGGIDNSV